MWQAIPAHPGYFVNPEGEVLGKYGRVLKPQLGTNGYLLVYPRVGGQSTTRSVHRLMALTFIPNPENKRDVNHKNGDKLDNHIDNLEWVTHAENAVHGFANGLLHRGEAHPNSKLTVENVRTIREIDQRKEMPRYRIAQMFNVDASTISSICNRKSWAWLA